MFIVKSYGSLSFFMSFVLVLMANLFSRLLMLYPFHWLPFSGLVTNSLSKYHIQAEKLKFKTKRMALLNFLE